MRWIALLFVPAALAADKPTVAEVLGRIRQHTGVEWKSNTVDTIKAGEAENRVTGIATTFAATLEVLQQAAASGKNLIITHEPTFYSHLDSTANLESNAVYLAKRAFIDQHGLTVFRFHDYWHQRRPDGIFEGMTSALGWQKFRVAAKPGMFEMPPTTLNDLAAQAARALHSNTSRVIGDPKMKVTKVALLPGATGSDRQIQLLERDDVEVLVIGETREWETVEYTRDAVTEGRRKALIILGHVPSEEAGMDECAKWLRTFVPEVPVEFIPAKEPFWFPR